MSLSIKSNDWVIGSLISVNSSYQTMVGAMEKMASGWRINRASDDPAGLVISEQMRSRIASLNQEMSNISMQIDKYETGSSALLQMRDQLTQMRSLAVAATNGAVNDEATQQAYQSAVDNLVQSYNQVIEQTSFGNQTLLDGSEGSIAAVAEMPPLDLSSPEAAEEAISTIDETIGRIDSCLVDLGATQENGLEARLRNLRIEAENLTAAESQIRDTDYALEYSRFLQGKLLLESSMSLMAYRNMSTHAVLRLLED